MADIEDYYEICDARATTWRMTMKIFLRTTFGLGWLLVGIGAVRSFDPAWLVMWLGFTVMILSVIGGEIFL